VTRHDDQAPRLFAGDDEYWPQVYIACSLTAIADDVEAQQLLKSWCHIVREAINTETAGGDVLGESRAWTVRCDAPIDRSAPWKDADATGEDIYRRNSRALWTDNDAIIVLGFRGGSIGVGQELEWAIQQGIPALYLQPPGNAVSRQVLGAAAEADIAIEAFEEPRELDGIVRRWLSRRRRVIEDGPRLRAMTRERLLLAQAWMVETWRRLDIDERIEVCATARLKPARVNRLLLEPDALAAASTGVLLRLTSALGLEIGALLSPSTALSRRLSPRQLVALRQAASENRWDGATVVELIIDAERTLAEPGVRRLRFERLQDWVRFHERPRDR
jgi:hypothetical protein